MKANKNIVKKNEKKWLEVVKNRSLKRSNWVFINSNDRPKFTQKQQQQQKNHWIPIRENELKFQEDDYRNEQIVYLYFALKQKKTQRRKNKNSTQMKVEVI